MTTLGEIMLRGAERFGPREALADPGEAVSYAQLGGTTFQLARALQRLGLAPGERSLIVLPNSVAFVRAHFANLLTGAVSVPCDAAVSAETLAGICASCMPWCLLTDAAALKRLTASRPLPAGLKRVVLLDGQADGIPGAIDGRALMAGEAEESFAVARSTADLAALMYTTGTTGRPKGVMLSHASGIL